MSSKTMVGTNSNVNKKGAKTGAKPKKSGSLSGRTSPGLNVKRFTIPKKQKDLLNEVELDSSEYLREVLPIIQQSYRDSNSKNKFSYVKAQLVHNAAIKKEYLEKKRELKDEGRNEKELTDSFAFLCVDKEEVVKQLCSESLTVSYMDRYGKHCLGDPKMGVHLCRYADIIQRSAVPQEGILLIFKIMKGKIKAVPLVYGEDMLEPTPNYECHVAKNSGEEQPSSARIRIFDSSQIYIYDFDPDEVEFRPKPRNVSPYAAVHFTYSDTGSALSASASASFNRKPVAVPSESTPTRSVSIPETVNVAVVAPCFPRDEVVTERPKPDKDRHFNVKYAEYSERSYRLWSGQLHNKSGNSCRVSLVSFGLSFLPCQMPETLSSLKATRMNDLRLPTRVFTGAIPMLSRKKEDQANGKYYLYAEMQSLDLDDAVYTRFLNYLSSKQLVLKKALKENVMLYILPTSQMTGTLGLTADSHPKMLHCLFESCVPMVSHLTDVSVKQAKHKQKLNLESAPIHDIDKDHIKRLRFQASLARLFYEQNRDLRELGVKGEELTMPVTTPVRSNHDRQEGKSSSERQTSNQPLDYQQGEQWKDPQLGSYHTEQPPGDPHVEHQGGANWTEQQLGSHPLEHQANNQNVEHQQAGHQMEHQGGYSWTNLQPNSQQIEQPKGGYHVEHQVGNNWKDHHFDTPLSEHQANNQHMDHQTGSHQLEHQGGNNSWTGPQPSSHQVEQPQAGHTVKHQGGKNWTDQHPESHQLQHQGGNQLKEHQTGSHHLGHQVGNNTWTDHQATAHRVEQPVSLHAKHQSSKSWTDQQPDSHRLQRQGSNRQHEYTKSSKRGVGRQQTQRLEIQPSLVQQDPRLKLKQSTQPEATDRELPQQIKEVASKVHDMLTGGMNLGLLGASGSQVTGPETEDEKLSRMRATLQSLVEERAKLVKSKAEKPSENDPIPVPAGSELGNSASTTADTTTQIKCPPNRQGSNVEKPTEKQKGNDNEGGKGRVAESSGKVARVGPRVRDGEGKPARLPRNKKRKADETERSESKKMRTDDADRPKTWRGGEGGSERKQKVASEIGSAEEMRYYLEHKRGSESSKRRDQINSAEEMRMFLEHADRMASQKPRRIRSASEMRQFLNQPLDRHGKLSKKAGGETHKGQSTNSSLGAKGQGSEYGEPPASYGDFDGKTPDELLTQGVDEASYDFPSSNHRVTWNVTAGVRVSFNWDQGGAKDSVSRDQGGAMRLEDEGDNVSSCISAVLHKSRRSRREKQMDSRTKEGLAYQICQVIHHVNQPRRINPRKVKEIQKEGEHLNSSSSSSDACSVIQSPPQTIPDGACFLGDLDNEEGITVAMASSHDNDTWTQYVEYAPNIPHSFSYHLCYDLP